MTFTFADLYTAQGVAAAAAAITALVALLKGVSPWIAAKVSGALMAFVASALLYLASVTAVPLTGPDSVLALVLAWIACATASVGIHSATIHAKDAATGTRVTP